MEEVKIAKNDTLTPFARAFARPRLTLKEWHTKAKETAAKKEQERKTMMTAALLNHESSEAMKAKGLASPDWKAFQKGMATFQERIAKEEPAVPQRKCVSEWDGNCDRSEFQGKKYQKNKKAVSLMSKEEKDLMKTDISGFPDGGDPESCVSIGTSMTDAWCKLNCGGHPPNCPSALCKCEVSKTAVVTKEALGKWGRCVGCYGLMARHLMART